MEQEFEKPKVNGYTVYSKTGCTSCLKVKKLLNDSNAIVSIIDCDEYLIKCKEEFLKFIEEAAEKSVRMFPIVFFEGKYIGGYSDTEHHYNRLEAFSNDVFI